MPTAGVPTTLDALEDVLVAAMESTTPRYQRDQQSGWKRHQRRHTPGVSCRVFRLQWDPDGYADDGVFTQGAFTAAATLNIIVDYGGVPDQDLPKMAEDDHYHLRDVFNRLKLTTDGLRTVKAIDWDYFIENEGDRAQVVHQYEITYLRARA